MSNSTNVRLIDEALEWAEVWEGTLHAELLRFHIKNQDLDALTEAVAQAKTDWYDLEERTLEYDEVM